MPYYIRFTENQSYHEESRSCGSKESHTIYPSYHPQTNLIGHGYIVKQRVRDSHIAVICHYSQHVTFCNSKNTEEVELSHAFWVGDEIFFCHKVYEHFGSNDSWLTIVNKGQTTE